MEDLTVRINTISDRASTWFNQLEDVAKAEVWQDYKIDFADDCNYNLFANSSDKIIKAYQKYAF
jgi:hypothetical protein